LTFKRSADCRQLSLLSAGGLQHRVSSRIEQLSWLLIDGGSG
jgi:hypothetical protein